MARNSISSIVFASAFGVLAVLTLPGFFRHWYDTGTGHALAKVVVSENVAVDSIPAAQLTAYRSRAEDEGFKCAVYMVLGQHVPALLLILFTIGLLAPSVAHRFRVFLRFAFWTVWLLGMLFLSVGAGYWGSAPAFPASLGPAFVIYLHAALAFGIIIGIGKLIQRRKRRKSAGDRDIERVKAGE